MRSPKEREEGKVISDEDSILRHLNGLPYFPLKGTSKEDSKVGRERMGKWDMCAVLEVDEEHVETARQINIVVEVWGCSLLIVPVFSLKQEEMPLTESEDEERHAGGWKEKSL